MNTQNKHLESLGGTASLSRDLNGSKGSTDISDEEANPYEDKGPPTQQNQSI